MSESFEEVYDRLYPQLHNPCALWKAATIREWLDDLMTSHDRELERCMREQYARGYEDGRRSMDAKHYAVALRLMHLPLDEDSHGNLIQIAGAIWHSDFGWTQGACRALRDELVRLMGGVRDEPLPNPCRTSGEPDKIGENCETDGSNAVESSKCRENHESGRITDELREFKGHINAGLTPEMVLALRAEINCIADRIDEQFDRICRQQRAVLRQTIDEQDGRITKLVRQRDELQAKLDAIREALDG